MKEKRFLKVLSSKGTWKILRFLDEHNTGQYKEMAKFVAIATLSVRSRDFATLRLIPHHLERRETRAEWYELTDRGKKVMELLKRLVVLVENQLNTSFFHTSANLLYSIQLLNTEPSKA